MCCVRSAASEKLCMRRQIVVRSNACTSARRPVKKMTFTTEAGSNPATRFPKSGPHDERLGYVGLPSFIDRLSARGFLIEWQERDRLRSWTSWRRAVTMFARPRAILRRRPLASFVRESARAPAEHARHRKIAAASDNDLALLRGVIGTSRETNRRRNGGGRDACRRPCDPNDCYAVGHESCRGCFWRMAAVPDGFGRWKCRGAMRPRPVCDRRGCGH